jgi:hypothetical protein
MALTSTTTSGGENPGASAPGLLLKASQAFLEEALAPLGDDLTSGVEPTGNLLVVHALGCHQHDPGPDDLAIRQRIASRLGLQAQALFRREFNRERAFPRQGRPPLSGSILPHIGPKIT